MGAMHKTGFCRALSYITENRNVEAREPLMFQYLIVVFCLKKVNLQQSCHVSWRHHEPCTWEPRSGNLQDSPAVRTLLATFEGWCTEGCQAVDLHEAKAWREALAEGV